MSCFSSGNDGFPRIYLVSPSNPLSFVRSLSKFTFIHSFIHPTSICIEEVVCQEHG